MQEGEKEQRQIPGRNHDSQQGESNVQLLKGGFMLPK